MRHLPPRPALPVASVRRLTAKTKLIEDATDRPGTAIRIYTSSRQAKWFEPITDALKAMAGPGERCMFCSGSESSQVEHFRPKAIFPLRAMEWENLFWTCGICNQSKGDRFPPDTEVGEMVIDPTTENVWEFFFVDEFGNLTERWQDGINDVDQRARTTVRILSLDRDALQQSRQLRLQDLKEKARDALILLAHELITIEDLRQRINGWKLQPIQPDVADYFLQGPGSNEQPFADLLAKVNP